MVFELEMAFMNPIQLKEKESEKGRRRESEEAVKAEMGKFF